MDTLRILEAQRRYSEAMAEVKAIESASFELIQYMIDKHNLRSPDDFTCPYMRKLAEACKNYMDWR